MSVKTLLIIAVVAAASVAAIALAIIQASVLARISYAIVPGPQYSVQQASISLGTIQEGSSGTASGSGSITVYSGTVCFEPSLNTDVCNNFTSFTAYVYINGNLTWVLSCNPQAQVVTSPICLGPGNYPVYVYVNYQAQNCYQTLATGQGACYEASNEPLIYITPTS